MATSKKISIKDNTKGSSKVVAAKNTAKDTIYIDIDDEITAIIEKVRASDSKIVALVLPKRTTTLKSIVNMRLLKRTTDNLKKNLVLITSEASLLPLAGAVGVHVAKTLQSQPVVPPAPEIGDSAVNMSDDTLGDEAEIDNTKSIGELASSSAMEDDDESIDVGDAAEAAGAALAADKMEGGRKAPNKKLKVPNFEKFRLRLMLIGGAIILLFIGMIMANTRLLKAQVTVKTDSTTSNSDLTIKVDPATSKVDQGKLVIPGQVVNVQSDGSASAPATGQKDKGNKASGKVTLTLTDCTQDQVTVYAGTAVSTAGLTYITQSTVTLNKVEIGPNCNPPAFSASFSKDVNVTAQAGGTKYNIDSGKTFTVAGASNVSATNAAAISGGTSDIVKVVSQTDINTAKQALIDKLKASGQDDVNKKAAGDGVFVIADSFSSKVGSLTNSAKVGDEATDVKVSGTVTFSLTTVSRDDLDKIIKADAEKHIDTSKQAITDTGLDNATLKVSNKKSSGALSLEVQTTVTAGAHLDEQTVKDLVGGKKKGEAQTALTGQTGVKDVNISLSPFWATKIPKDASKITVKFEANATSQ